MALYSIQQQQFGLAKESVRGTAETAPAKWYPVLGIPEFSYELQHLEDEGIRGVAEKLVPVAGIKVGTFKVKLALDPQSIGEFLYGLLGSVASAQQGGTAAYQHTFTRSTAIAKQSYTFFVDRGLGVLKYNLGVIKKITFTGGVDNLITADIEGFFKSEASGGIGSPSYPTQRYLSFQNVDYKVAGSSNTDVKEWTLSIDNGMAPHRTLTGSQDAGEFYARGRLMIEGGFTIYFQNTTERDKFLGNTSVALRILATGGIIGATIYSYLVDLYVYAAKYKAFPYGEDMELLAAKTTFEGYYSSGDSKATQAIIMNTDTAY